MKALRGVVGVLTFFVVMPIWYFLLYKILSAVNASEVMWLLYWIYIPVAVVAGIVQKLIEAAASE